MGLEFKDFKGVYYLLDFVLSGEALSDEASLFTNCEEFLLIALRTRNFFPFITIVSFASNFEISSFSSNVTNP